MLNSLSLDLTGVSTTHRSEVHVSPSFLSLPTYLGGLSCFVLTGAPKTPSPFLTLSWWTIFLFCWAKKRELSNTLSKDFLVVPVVKTLPFTVAGTGSILCLGAKIPYDLQPKNQNIMQWYCNKLNKDLRMDHIKRDISMFVFNWRITALKYCVGLCHTSTWMIHKCKKKSLKKTPWAIHRQTHQLPSEPLCLEFLCISDLSADLHPAGFPLLSLSCQFLLLIGLIIKHFMTFHLML